MNTLLLLFSFVFGISAVPVVFDRPLWEGKDSRFAKVLHGKVDAPDLNGSKLRFLLLVPKLGFSDCKTWFALTWNVLNADVFATRFVGGVKDGEEFKYPLVVGGWDWFADFVHGKVTLGEFKKLWKLLPSHLAVHKVWWTFKAVW
ncbi:hypothetical protein MACJ_000523 [Theileria orientalis]|uniref:Uncharacterized protein n=1 Tax=Theileria orientalis TaxID=68886 RepID=A0A976M466_THEOR|nr:hypothetical protein MACJ_000523 [Theileria orientalis]